MSAASQNQISRKSDNWSSRLGFIMAAVGSSVGLGNFWRFPYTAGENGGGAFIILYLVSVAAIGLPILMTEFAMGRKSGRSSVEGIQYLARQEGRSENWGMVGWIGVFTSFFILSFYVVISAWLMAYVLQSFQGFSGITAEESGQRFGATIGDVWGIKGLLFLFIAANVFVIGRGVKGGLEKATSILMPVFFLMLVAVVIFALMTGDVGKTASFIFEPKWEDVTFKTFLEAIGQAFFSLGVGVGLMLTYGAYLTKDVDIPRASFTIAGADTFVAMIAGFAIFPIVFAAGLDAAAGPGLFFVSMPVAFGSIPGGDIFAILFFALALFAAFTSSISLMEISVAWLEERQGVNRMGAAIGVGCVLMTIGAAYIYSTAYLDFVDTLTTILLPLGGLLVAIFAIRVLSEDALDDSLGTGLIKKLWSIALKWIAPIFVGVVLVFGSLDKVQDTYKLQLPGFLTKLVGPNAVLEDPNAE